MQQYLKKSELEIRKIYKLDARNLYIGVWNGYRFMGIRRKFDLIYLDSETHWDENGTDPYDEDVKSYGTAKPLKDLNIIVPKEISLEECFLRDQFTRRLIEKNENDDYCFSDTKLVWKKIQPMYFENKKLFKFLQPINSKIGIEMEYEFDKLRNELRNSDTNNDYNTT